METILIKIFQSAHSTHPNLREQLVQSSMWYYVMLEEPPLHRFSYSNPSEDTAFCLLLRFEENLPISNLSLHSSFRNNEYECISRSAHFFDVFVEEVEHTMSVLRLPPALHVIIPWAPAHWKIEKSSGCGGTQWSIPPQQKARRQHSKKDSQISWEIVDGNLGSLAYFPKHKVQDNGFFWATGPRTPEPASLYWIWVSGSCSASQTFPQLCWKWHKKVPIQFNLRITKDAILYLPRNEPLNSVGLAFALTAIGIDWNQRKSLGHI